MAVSFRFDAVVEVGGSGCVAWRGVAWRCVGVWWNVSECREGRSGGVIWFEVFVVVGVVVVSVGGRKESEDCDVGVGSGRR